MATFESFHLDKIILGHLLRHGITQPTPIQEDLIPLITSGRDVLARSETGSGKTLGFALPLIDSLNRRDGLRVLCLVPTRELATQIAKEFIKYSQGKHLGVTAVYGGVSISEQVKKLKLTNIIVGTPGRLLDLLERGDLRLDSITTLIFDEADRMLDMGFLPDIERIVSRVPKNRQTLMLSATLPKEVVQAGHKYLRSPVQIEKAAVVKPEFLRQTYYRTTPEQKLPLLLHLLRNERDLALVFCNRKHITAKLARKLGHNGVHAKCLHGDMSQNQRERVVEEYRQKRLTVLVATDVAARGLHIDDITHVYNYEIPRDVETYTHRVGRTARAGNRGDAISLVATPEEQKFFQQILFTYNGRIDLRHADTAAFPALAPAPPQVHGQTLHGASGVREESGRKHAGRTSPRFRKQRRRRTNSR